MEFGHNRKRFFFCLKNFKILFFDLAELIKKWKLFSSFFCFSILRWALKHLRGLQACSNCFSYSIYFILDLVLSWLFRISANFDNRRQRWRDDKKLVCVKRQRGGGAGILYENKSHKKIEESQRQEIRCEYLWKYLYKGNFHAAIVRELYNVKIGKSRKCS